MTVLTVIEEQLWQSHFFLSVDQYTHIRDLYRIASTSQLAMKYDNRLQTSTRELNNVCAEFAPRISEIVGEKLSAQVGYISIDLPETKIHMHKLHPDIRVQVQIPMTMQTTDGLEYAYCINTQRNSQTKEYLPRMLEQDCVYVKHMPRSAIIYKNFPRTYNGMMTAVPQDTVRETLWLNYTQ